MQVFSSHQSEIRLTLEAAIDLANDDSEDRLDVRATLAAAGFPRAVKASAASIERLSSRISEFASLVRDLPDLEPHRASERVNEELTELAIAPAIVDHDGVGPHLHWTATTATFDDQVMADMLMALAQELCDNGTIRFGRCDASACEHLFYDSTRNRSRRFCDDPRCASRTHTADHRARAKNDT